MPTLPAPSTLLTDPSHGVVPSVRAPQLGLASHIAHALREGEGLAAEAGTGVGKTLAYAGEAVEMLLEQCRLVDAYDEKGEALYLDSGERATRIAGPNVVIATATKALQAQIVEQELPRLAGGVARRMKAQGASDDDVSLALRKITFAKKVGKKNHLCIRRVMQMAQRSADVKKQLPIYQDFTDRVPGWVIDDAPENKPLPEDAWRFGVGYCNRDRCAWADGCAKNGYLAAKDAADSAQILVTNHHMIAADLTLRRREVRATLPDAVDAFILDEAHKFPDTLREALTVTFSAKLWADSVTSYAQLRFELEERAAGLPQFLPDIGNVRSSCDAFLRDGSAEPEQTANAYAKALQRALNSVLNVTQCAELPDLQKRAAKASEHTAQGAFLKEMSSYAANLALHESALVLLVDDVQMRGRYVLSSEASNKAGEPPTRKLVPIMLASAWTSYLGQTGAVPIYVSATLATGTGEGADAFLPFLNEMGRKYGTADVATFLADSPFDYATQAVLYTPAGVEFKGKPLELYARELVEQTRPLLLANEGHAFVLFTSNADLAAYEAALGESGYPYPILSQGSSEQVKTRGASIFKRTPNATLLGLKTFFEGVDVPGLGLSLVIIPKLPFQFPDATLEAKRSRFDDSYSGFRGVDIPIMLTHLRQMAGRLIRSTADRGVVAVFDPRLHTKNYGRGVVDALGFPTRRTQPEGVIGYLSKIAERRNAAAPARAKPADPFAAALSGDA